uniref:(California timema) hypothetical protein n=1 Tax=Timema californicum TaxID=61474 RepID=A0A7R9J811_TIMCA|nr:unnamed protein product [Timema californicum]
MTTRQGLELDLVARISEAVIRDRDGMIQRTRKNRPRLSSLPVWVIRLSTSYANGLVIGKFEFRRSEPAFSWRQIGKPFRKNHLSSLDRVSNFDLPVLGRLAQHETSALTSYATEAVPDMAVLCWQHCSRCRLSVMATLFQAGTSKSIWKWLKNIADFKQIQKSQIRFPATYRVSCEALGLERSQLSIVRTIEKLLG